MGTAAPPSRRRAGAAQAVGAWDRAPWAQTWAEVSPPVAAPPGPWFIAHHEEINALVQAPQLPPQRPAPKQARSKQVSKPTPPKQAPLRPAVSSPMPTSPRDPLPSQASPVK